MADAAAPPETGARKRNLKPVLFGLVLAILCGAGGFFVTWSGMLGGAGGAEGADAAQPLPDIAFVPVDTVNVSIPGTERRSLRFTTQLEVERRHEAEVAALLPRILDVLNGYLRAVEPARFDQPGALLQIRAHLLRRIQIVTGEGRVRDLLVTEFIVQ